MLAKGPVGYLLESLYLQASGINENLVIFADTHPGIHLEHIPYQQLSIAVRDIGVKNRTKYRCTTRMDVIDLYEICVEATKTAKDKYIEKQLFQLNIIKNGARWNAEASFWAGKRDDKLCPLCNEMEEGYDHLWRCNRLDEARKRIDPTIAAISPDALPAPINIGVAAALSANICVFFWNTNRPDVNMVRAGCRGLAVSCQSNLGSCGRAGDLEVESEDRIKKLCGKHLEVHCDLAAIHHIRDNGQQESTARQVMNIFNKYGDGTMLVAGKVYGKPSASLDTYTDGSV